MPAPIDTFQCYRILFGPDLARQFTQAGHRELLRACDVPDHRLMAEVNTVQRERLKAVLQLCHVYYREQPESPEVIAGIGDVVRLIQPRLAHLSDRVIWLLCLDASGALIHEVMVQIGGDAMSPPVLRTVLRHALFKGAACVWIADFRPVEVVAVPPETREAFGALVQVGAAVGVEFCDWVIFGSSAVRSVREASSVETAEPTVDREAA